VSVDRLSDVVGELETELEKAGVESAPVGVG
jgi:hypothetical protein